MTVNFPASQAFNSQRFVIIKQAGGKSHRRAFSVILFFFKDKLNNGYFGGEGETDWGLVYWQE